MYTIASACQNSRLQEVEFSLKAFIYLAGRTAAARVRAGRAPAHPRHGAEPSGSREQPRGKTGKAANQAAQKFLGTSRPRPSSCQLHSANVWPQTKRTRNYTCPTSGIPPGCPHVDIFLEETCLYSGMECLYWDIFLSWFLCKQALKMNGAGLFFFPFPFTNKHPQKEFPPCSGSW